MYCCCIFSLFYVVCRVNLPLMLCVKIACLCKVLLSVNRHVLSVSPFPGNVLLSVNVSCALT